MLYRFFTFLKEYKFILLLISIAITSHWEWFKLNSILAGGDWGFWYTESLKESLSFYGPWRGELQLGVVNIQLYFNIFFSLWAVLAQFGIETFQASKVNIFMPVALLGFIAPYFLVKKELKNNFIAFVCALFYGTTTYYFSEQTSHLPIAFVYGITPLIFLFYIHALKKNKVVNWLLFAFLYSIGIGYELRMMYIVSFILLFYSLYFLYQNGWKTIRNYLIFLNLTSLIIFLLNLYWFLPTILGGITGSIEVIAGRGLFGDNLVNILRGFTISHWSWTGGTPGINFNPQPIPIYFWILPVFIFSTFLIKTNKYLKQMLFFFLISLLGILLVKQSAPPFSWIYPFLRDYFPGFILFRESSKLYLLVAFGYLGLLAYGLKLLSEKLQKSLYPITCILFLLLFSWNLKPMIIKEYRTLLIEKEIPKEYITFKTLIFKNNSTFRVLWVPRMTIWSFRTAINPNISMVNIVSANWEDLYDFKTPELTTGEGLIRLLNGNFAPEILNVSGIRYIAIPLQDNFGLGDIFQYYGEPREFYIKGLDNLAYLNRVDLGTGDLIIYENASYRPRVYITSEQETIHEDIPYEEIEHEVISSAQHDIEINNVSGDFYVNFSESYHPNWKLRIGEFSWFDALWDTKYFIEDDNHTKNDANLNSFYISEEACVIYECTQNSDGSYDIKATIYFKPQSYFYLGVIISLSTLGAILIFLGYEVVKRLKHSSIKKLKS